MKNHQRKAKAFVKLAKKEFKQARKNGFIMQNACGKLWLSMVELVYEKLTEKGVAEEKLPKNYRGLRYFLQRYETRDFRKLFGAFYGDIHIAGYYNGELPPADFKEYLEEMEELLDLR